MRELKFDKIEFNLRQIMELDSWCVRYIYAYYGCIKTYVDVNYFINLSTSKPSSREGSSHELQFVICTSLILKADSFFPLHSEESLFRYNVQVIYL